MIAKGAMNNSGAKLAAYMVRSEKGEKAELYQVYGFATGDIHEAFRSIDAMAKGTRVRQPFFHVAVRNLEGEDLSRADWMHTADRIEAKLGLSGQGRAIAIHRDEKTGHEHMHVAWSRIDDESLKAIPLPFFKTRLKEISRELEIELGLTRVSSERPRPERAPVRSEEEQSRRLGTDLHGIRGAIREAYEQSDSGKAFVAALHEKGITLCQGDRRDYVAIDSAGGMHTLGKRLLGDSAAQVRDRLGDLDRSLLPTVAYAREHIREARDEAQRVQAAERMAKLPDVQAIREAWRRAKHDAPAFLQQLEERGFTVGHVTAEDANTSRQLDKTAKSHNKDYFSPIYAEGELVAIGPRGQAWRLDSKTLDDRSVATAFAAIDKTPLLSLDQAWQVAKQFREPRNAEPSKWEGRADTRGPNPIAAVAPVLDGGIRVAEGLVSGLEQFLFGGAEAPRQEPGAAAMQQHEPTPVESFRREYGLTEPQVALQSADFIGKHDTFNASIPPLILEAMRRNADAQRLREMTDEDRDRER